MALFFSVIALLVANATRAESETPVAVAAPRQADAAMDTTAKISDPIFSMLEKLKAPQKDEKADADVVELGDGPDYTPSAGVPANGKWIASPEEKGPPSVSPAAPRDTRADDPEFIRPTPAPDPEPENPHTGSADPAKSNAFKPRADDPEVASRVSPDAGVSDAEPSVEVQPAHTPPANNGAVQFDRPRFVSGEGLDSDAAEVVAGMALDAQQKHDADPAAPSAPASVLAMMKKNEAAAPAPEPAPATPAAAPTDPKKARPNSKDKDKDKGKTAKKEPLDPEKAYADVIAQYEKDKPARQKAAEEAKREADERRSRYSNLRLRDDRAALVLDLLSKNKGLGTVSGKIVDAVTKLPTPARVRLVDATDIPIDAPLPEGFWTSGEFTAQALIGMARLEITRGRFRPTYKERLDVHAGLPVPFQEVVACPPEYNFSKRGWWLADLNAGVRVEHNEIPMWLGHTPNIQDLARVAIAEGVQILGVPAPWTDGKDGADPAVLDQLQSPNLMLLPVMNGPRHPFYGCAMSIGMRSMKGISAEISAPEIPLRESFEEIRSRGGLGVFTQLNGLRTANIRSEIIPLFPRLEQSRYFGNQLEGATRLYAASELPFDTVVGPVYDTMTFDGSEMAEKLWFNLLNHGYPVSIIGAGNGSLEGGHIPFGNTFIHVDGKPTADAILTAIKAGNTVVTYGPAAFCRIAERDMGPGSILPADNRPLTLHIRAYASMTNQMQIDKIEVIRNGQVIHAYVANNGETEIDQHSVPITEASTSWFVVRVTERPMNPNSKEKGGVAWTSPIYFRSPNFTAPQPAVSHVRGTLRIGITPTEGAVKAVAPGVPDHQVSTDANGRFTIDVPASGTLIFEAPNAEPMARRIFEHPRVQAALGQLQAERAGNLKDQADRSALFDAWGLLLSDIEWDVSLNPASAEPAITIHK